MEWIITHYFSALSIVISVMLIAWLLYLTFKNPGVVDVFWAFGLVLAGTVLAVNPSSPSPPSLINAAGILLIMLWVWGLRLGLFLFLTRVARKEKDERYMDLSRRWQTGVHLKFLINFLFQAFLQSLLAMGLLLFTGPVTTSSGFPVLAGLALALYIIGLGGEIVSDYQLYRFKNDPRNKSEGKGQVCDVGLWSLSRHPNYFSEFLIWTGMGLWSFAYLPEEIGWVSFLAPLTLLFIFFALTIPLTEKQALKKRPQYADYQRQVSVFIPWPRK